MSPRPLAAALALAALAGCVEPPDSLDDVFNVRLVLESDGPSGLVAHRVTHADGLQFVARLRQDAWDTSDFNPVHAALVFPNGTVRPFVANLDGDDAHWAEGDGVVYAGRGDAHAESPRAVASSGTNDLYLPTMSDAREATLVLLWGNERGRVRLDVAFREGTRVGPAVHANVTTFQMKDFRGGTRLGTPLVAAHDGDALALDGAGQLFGYLALYRAGTGEGQLVLETPTVRREVPLAGNASTFAFEFERRYYTADAPARLTLDYTGDGRRTKVLGVVASLPPDTLPRDLWSAFDE